MPIIEFNDSELDEETQKAIAEETLVVGATAKEWWRRQRNDLHQRFMDEIRTSMENGEGIQKATTRVVGGTVDGVAVPGVMAGPRHHAEGLVRTSIAEVVNTARRKSLQNFKDVTKALEQVSTLDGRTSEICISYSGQVWDIETLQPVPPSTLPFNGGPPRHYNCRSTLVPVLRSFEELGVDAEEASSTRASMDGQVPSDITFDNFLRGKSKSFQNELLGPSRARLWRSGKISLTQLVDMRGNPLTVEQLEKLAG